MEKGWIVRKDFAAPWAIIIFSFVTGIFSQILLWKVYKGLQRVSLTKEIR